VLCGKGREEFVLCFGLCWDMKAVCSHPWAPCAAFYCLSLLG
jgi:hypothetical protein